MNVEISDEVLIAEGVEPFVGSVFSAVDRLFPGDGNAMLRHAVLVMFAQTALERMTHEQRLWLIGAIETRWKKGLN